MNKHQIAHALEEMAAILEINGENPFKVRAYQNAARTIDGLAEDIGELIEQERLIEIKGIGKNIAAHVEELFRTGSFEEYRKLRASIPPGLLEMLTIPGVGAKRVRMLWKSLNIVSVDDLERACEQGKVATLEGFGERTQEKILHGIHHIKQYRGRFLFAKAQAAAMALLEKLRNHSSVIRADVAGSLRRCMETVKDLDFVAATKHPQAVADFFAALPEVSEVIAKGDTKVAVTLTSGMNVDVRLVSNQEYPFALHHFTGSKAHNVAMRSRAKDRGIKMNEYGLFKGRQERPIPCRDETDVFAALGLAYIPPELREDMGEIPAAEEGPLPRLIDASDIQGVLHNHSTYSDGRGSIEGMALAAKALGWSYIGISDHSKSASYAGGMQLADIRRQHCEIDLLNEKLSGIRILKGIEVDILPDGSLDYSDDILETFEFVIASIHTKFEMDEADMTRRICRAIGHPLVTILAHPTGRLLLSREPYAVSMPDVIACAAEHNVIIELNANPLRLDVDWRLGPLLKEKKVKVIISPDAHGPEQLEYVRYGIGMARKAWLTKEEVVNCLPLARLLKYLKK